MTEEVKDFPFGGETYVITKSEEGVSIENKNRGIAIDLARNADVTKNTVTALAILEGTKHMARETALKFLTQFPGITNIRTTTVLQVRKEIQPTPELESIPFEEWIADLAAIMTEIRAKLDGTAEVIFDSDIEPTATLDDRVGFPVPPPRLTPKPIAAADTAPVIPSEEPMPNETSVAIFEDELEARIGTDYALPLQAPRRDA